MATFHDRAAQSVNIGMSQQLPGYNVNNNSTGFASGVASLDDNTAASVLQSILDQTIHGSEDFVSAIHDIQKVFIKGNVTNAQVLAALKQISKDSPKIKNTNEILSKLKDSYNGDSKKLRSDINVLLKGLDRSLKQIYSTNQKQLERLNINYISKAFQKGMEQYAVTGMGRKATEFYNKASDKQVMAMVAIRKAIEKGDVINKSLWDKLKDNKEAHEATYLGVGHVANFGGGPHTTNIARDTIGLIKAIMGNNDDRKNAKAEANEQRIGLLASMRNTSLMQAKGLEGKQSSALQQKNEAISGRSNLIDNGFKTVNSSAASKVGLTDLEIGNIKTNLNSGSTSDLEDLISRFKNVIPEDNDEQEAIANTVLGLEKLLDGVSRQNQVVTQADGELERFSNSLRTTIDSIAAMDSKLQELAETHLADTFKEIEKAVRKNSKGLNEDLITSAIDDNKNIAMQQLLGDLNLGEVGDPTERIQNSYLAQGKNKLSDSEMRTNYGSAVKYTEYNKSKTREMEKDPFFKPLFGKNGEVSKLTSVAKTLNSISKKADKSKIQIDSRNPISDFGSSKSTGIVGGRSDSMSGLNRAISDFGSTTKPEPIITTRDSNEMNVEQSDDNSTLTENLDKIANSLDAINNSNKDETIIKVLETIKEVLHKSLGDDKLANQIARELKSTELTVKGNSTNQVQVSSGADHR